MTTPPPPSTVAHRVLAAVIVFLGAGLAGSFELLLVVPGLVALVAPSTASMASVGAMALGHVALRLADGSLPWLSTPNVVFLGVLAVLGAAAAWLSFRAPEPAPRRPWLPLLPLVVMALLQLLGVATAGELQMSAVQPTVGRLGLLLVGLGAGLVRLRTIPLRWTGVVLLTAAFSVLLLSLGTERLTGGEPYLAWSRGIATAGPSAPIDGAATLFAVSPTARYFALREPPRQHSSGISSYSVRDFSGFQRGVSGLRIDFLSDEHLLVLAQNGTALELRLEPVRGGPAVWTRPLPDLMMPELYVDGTGRWSVEGSTATMNERVMVTAIGDGAVRRLVARASPEGWVAIPLGEGVLILERQPREPGPQRFSLRGSPLPRRWDVRLVGPAGERRLGSIRGSPRCSGPDATGVLCQESVDGVNRGVLWSIDATGEMRRVGFAPADLFERIPRDGVLGAARSAGDAILVDTRRREGIRLGSPALTYVRSVHPVPGGAVVHHHDGGVARVTVFRIAGSKRPSR